MSDKSTPRYAIDHGLGVHVKTYDPPAPRSEVADLEAVRDAVRRYLADWCPFKVVLAGDSKESPGHDGPWMELIRLHLEDAVIDFLCSGTMPSIPLGRD